MKAGLVSIPIEQLAGLCRTGHSLRCIEGMPEDADFLDAHYDHARYALVLRYEYPSFDKVYQGAIPQRYNLELQELVIEGDTL